MSWKNNLSGDAMALSAINGLRAYTTQPYTEVNVKRGMQHFLRAAWPTADPIATGTSRLVWFKVGATPVTVKLREFYFIGEEMRIRLFEGPTGVSGGTTLTIGNYNTANNVATLCQAKKNVTVTGNGVEFPGGDPEYFFGQTATGGRSLSSIPSGRERILNPDTEYLVEIANLGTGNARCQYFIDWYEGSLDIPNQDYP